MHIPRSFMRVLITCFHCGRNIVQRAFLFATKEKWTSGLRRYVMLKRIGIVKTLETAKRNCTNPPLKIENASPFVPPQTGKWVKINISHSPPAYHRRR